MLRCEFKGKNSSDFHNYAKPIITCNVLPETPDKSGGFYRRWCIVDFPNQFDEKSMLEDAAEAVKWKATGAKLIWRPNNLFGGKKDIAPLIIRWLEIVQPDGLQIPPFGDIATMYEVMKFINLPL
jgi:hypothetical protein